MRVSHILIAAFAALMPALGALCDRACLKSWLDQYLQAILKHDPQAACFGVLNEGAEPTVTTVRIRVEDCKITGAEWIIARRIAAGINGFDARRGKSSLPKSGASASALHRLIETVKPV